MTTTIRDPHFWAIAALTILIGLGYYGEQVGIGSKFFSSDYTHDLHRGLLLIPMLYAAAVFRLRGAVILSVIAFCIVIPRGLMITENPDPLLRPIIVMVIASIATFLLGIERGRSQHLAAEMVQRQRAEHKIQHINSVLHAIRSVNELIVQEKNRDQLLRSVCESLIQTRGYYNAWIALLDDSAKFAASAEAGLGTKFSAMLGKLGTGELTSCGRAALSQPDVVIINDPSITCIDCPLSADYSGRGAMTTRLEYEGKVYGLLSVSIPADLIGEEDEQALFSEVASDIAFALHDIELEKERDQAQRTLSIERGQLLSIFDGMDEVVYVADPQTYEMLYMNGQAKSQWGNGVGQKCHRVLQNLDSPCPFCSNDHIFGPNIGNSYIWEFQNSINHRWYRCIDKAIRWPDERMVRMEIAIDFTTSKEAEEKIRKLNAELEQRVIERTTELVATNKELEAFSYSVSHDLRAPLRSIDGFGQALLEDYNSRLDEQGKDYLQRMRAASQKMGNLIDDLLGLSRVTRSEMHRETVNLSQVVQRIAADLRQLEPERQIEFDIAEGVTAHGDAHLLYVALENLVENAWKFTRKHPTAKVEFGMIEHEGTPAYFVRDDGAGFDMAYAGKLFGAFQRLHDTREFEGTGIGLATVQRIIHRHGGQVWAEGVPEKGATFYFTLQ